MVRVQYTCSKLAEKAVRDFDERESQVVEEALRCPAAGYEAYCSSATIQTQPLKL